MDSFYRHILSLYFQKEITITEVRSLSGGCINNAVKVVSSEGVFCVKTNQASRYPGMFEKEAKGLLELKKANALQVTEPLQVGEISGTQFIILTYVESKPRRKDFWKDFARSLAQQHAYSNEPFGLDHDNYIGSLPQKNKWDDNWIRFWIENRLQPQLALASEKKLIDTKLQSSFEKLYQKLPDLLPETKPGLLHGDLWTGNFMIGAEGKAVLIDPAVYYGAPEAELAYTQLFGGFDEEFYHAYNEVAKLEKGYEKRFDLYNLYPLLVHVNLFGESYLTGIRNILLAYS